VLNVSTATLTPHSIWAPVLLVAGVVLVGALLTMSIRAKIARKNRQRPSPREMIDQAKRGRDHAETAHAAASQLADTARRLGAQLDNKARRLEVLIEEADERITALGRAAAAGAERWPPAATTETAAATHAPPPPLRALDPLTRAVYEHADAGRTPVEIAQHLDEQVGKVELILALREP
jgi:hypothetical protein